MFTRTQEPPTPGELNRILRSRRAPLLGRILGPRSSQEDPGLVEAMTVAVERCFRPEKFNEEMPLYILDIGQALLILFGQWLYDPHILRVGDEIFAKWKPGASMFKHFTMRFSANYGTALAITVHNGNMCQVERLPPIRFERLRECQLFEGSAHTLIEDLERAGITKQRNQSRKS